MCKVLIYGVKRYKMNELKLSTNLEAIKLNEQTSYRLNEINEVENYLECEIKERELVVKK